MAYCPRCGASAAPGASYCAACGASLAPAVPSPLPSAPAASSIPRGRAGARREPAMAIVLAVVTLGIYGLYYWWVVSREVDEYAGRPGHAHPLVRIGTILSIVAGVGLVFGFVGLLFGIVGAGFDGATPGPSMVGLIFGAFGTFLLFGLLGFAGGIVRLIGKYRLWQMLEEDERRRGVTTPLSAGLMVGLTIVGWFIAPFGWIVALIVLYMTAEHLDKTWAGAGA